MSIVGHMLAACSCLDVQELYINFFNIEVMIIADSIPWIETLN